MIKKQILIVTLLCMSFSFGIQAQETMKLGTNFWSFEWGSGRADYFKSGIDWNTVSNPWRQEFLDDISIYKVIRFMDQVPTNSSNVRYWNERTLPTENHYTTSRGAVAYEWQIDLCNRNQSDIWITVPHRTIEDYEANPGNNYWVSLANLLKEKLDPGLNIYLEFSNETWSSGGSFLQGDYGGTRGVQMGFDPDAYTAKFYFHVYAAMRLHKVFMDVFENEPLRVKKVVSGQNGSLWGTEQVVKAIQNQTNSQGPKPNLNPWNIIPDYFTIANYISTGDGAASNIRQLWADKLVTSAAHFQEVLDEITPLGIKLIAYEGGQHYTTNADDFSNNPESYDMYMEWLDVIKNYFDLTVHYTHTGTWSGGGAWGAKHSTDQSIEDAHRYRAMRDWVIAEEGEVQVSGIIVEPESVEITIGGNTSLTVQFLPINATNKNVVWTSSDETVVQIADGRAVAVDLGSATITATSVDGGFTAECEVLVIPYGTVILNPIHDTDNQSDVPEGTNTNLNISEWCHTYLKFDIGNLQGVIENAIVRIYLPGGMASTTFNIRTTNNDTWVEGGAKPSADQLITTVDLSATPSGYLEIDLTGYVQEKLEGNKIVSIALSNKIGGWTGVHSRQAGANNPELVIAVIPEGGPFAVTDVTLEIEEFTMIAGDTYTFIANIQPPYATNPELTWSSSNEDIATVNNGVVSAISPGDANITVTSEDGGFSATCEIEVLPLIIAVTGVNINETSRNIYVDESFMMIATVQPDEASNQLVSWSSNNEEVVTVADGLVTALAPGNAVITVTTEDGGHTASCSFNVSAPISTGNLEIIEATIYPNPVKAGSILTIAGVNTNKILNIQIIDITGKIIHLENAVVKGNIYQMNLNEMSSGLYILKLMNEQKNSILKLIVE